MIAAFWEGLGSLTLPCTLGLVVPVILVVLSAGGAFKSVAVAVGATVVGVVARIAGAPELPGQWLPLAGVAAAIGYWLAYRGKASAAALPALIAAAGWLPCVGPELGALLSRTAPLFPGAPAYAVGVGVLPAIALVVRRVPGRWPSRLGFSGGLAYAISTGVGAASEVTAGLARLSA